jgi:hypothetical protein
MTYKNTATYYNHIKTTFWCKNLIALNSRHDVHSRLVVIKITTLVNVWTSHWLTGRPSHSTWHLSESLVLRRLKVCSLFCSAVVVDMLTKMCDPVNYATEVVLPGAKTHRNSVRRRHRVLQKRRFLGTKIHGVTYYKTVCTGTAL